MVKKTNTISHEVYTDEDLGIAVRYTVFPEDETFNFEMNAIFINGRPITLNLEEMLFAKYWDEWYAEIRKDLMSRS